MKHKIQIPITNIYNDVETFNTYEDIFTHVTEKFLGSVSAPATISEMENYLGSILRTTFPKISINFTIKLEGDKVIITHHNNFSAELKRFYPESLF
jgi:hypothetical protein